MKKLKICVCVNTLTSVNSFVYSNHIHFFLQAVRNYGENISFIFFTPPRMAIDTARNEAAKIALSNGCDYLMFLDDDVLVPADTLQLLIDADKDVTAGLVVIRGLPFNVMAFKEMPDGNLTYYNELPKLDGTRLKKDETCKLAELEPLVECGAVGFSCCLIKTSALLKVAPPFFVTGTNSTEDVYFCVKLKKADKEASIFMQTQIQCGHLLTAEPIGWDNRKGPLLDYYTGVKKLEDELRPKRDLDYLSKVTRNMRGGANA